LKHYLEVIVSEQMNLENERKQIQAIISSMSKEEFIEFTLDNHDELSEGGDFLEIYEHWKSMRQMRKPN
jgi:S-methylmethionine-dependent homocysteine/selenocysteine methylase